MSLQGGKIPSLYNTIQYARCAPQPNNPTHTHTWMKKSLGLPTSDMQRSPLNRLVKAFSSNAPSVPKNTPSSPWLSNTHTKEAQRLWSSLATDTHTQGTQKQTISVRISPVPTHHISTSKSDTTMQRLWEAQRHIITTQRSNSTMQYNSVKPQR